MGLIIIIGYGEIVKNYYEEKFQVSDDERTENLLKILTIKNDHFFPFYFFIFNEIVRKSDGALAEMIGSYCFEMIYNYPNEVFTCFIPFRILY